MKSRSTTTKVSRRRSPLSRVARNVREIKPPSLLQRIAEVTDELQLLRSRLANAGDDLPAVGTHRINALETELEKLWEMRRREQAAPLRDTALTEAEEKVLAFPGGTRSRGT